LVLYKGNFVICAIIYLPAYRAVRAYAQGIGNDNGNGLELRP
jgi:hypothetical protein